MGGTVSYVVAFDPSTKVLGWCAMDTDTGVVLAHGVEAIDVKDGGWQHDQVNLAVHCVYGSPLLSATPFSPDGWTYELPYAPGQRAAYAYGAVCRSLETACRRVWPSAIAYDPYQPSVWRSLVGAGGRGKAGAMRAASEIAGPGVTLTQDEADAICIARALIIEHYGFEGGEAA